MKREIPNPDGPEGIWQPTEFAHEREADSAGADRATLIAGAVLIQEWALAVGDAEPCVLFWPLADDLPTVERVMARLQALLEQGRPIQSGYQFRSYVPGSYDPDDPALLRWDVHYQDVLPGAGRGRPRRAPDLAVLPLLFNLDEQITAWWAAALSGTVALVPATRPPDDQLTHYHPGRGLDLSVSRRTRLDLATTLARVVLRPGAPLPAFLEDT